MKKNSIVNTILLILCMAVIIYSLFFFEGKHYYFVSIFIILAGLLLFILEFEKRKPAVEEVVIIATMCALAVVSRIVFFSLPQIKPMAAFVIIAGVSLGSQTGFITGALSVFISNFYFGQGSYTPFQMFAMGLIGYFAGVIFSKVKVNRISLSIYAMLSIVFIYGGIVDINTLFYQMADNMMDTIIFVYSQGFALNVIFGVSTVCFLQILYRPLTKQLERIKKKYGLMENEN